MSMMSPEIQQMMSQAQGAPAQGGDQQDNASAADHLRAAIEHAQAALQMEPDDQDSQALASAIQALYRIVAARQKEQMDLMSGKATPRALSRAQG